MNSLKMLLFILLGSIYCLGSWADEVSYTGPSSRIIGGTTADEGDYPWMVSIQVSGHFCGGTLIGSQWVLTAAHCLEDIPAEALTLYVGISSLKSPQDGEKHSAEWLSIHPDYFDDNGILYSDVAIIKLNSPSNKTPITIIDTPSNANLIQNEKLWALGWGLTDSEDEESISFDLRQVDVSFQKDQVCEVSYGSGLSNKNDFWSRTLCAGEDGGGKDSCQGDSGGPLILNNNGEWQLAGIVSWGEGCALAGYYGMYSEVAFFQEWIEQRETGVTLVGPNKIGFLGLGRSKSDIYKLVNMGRQDAAITGTHISSNGRSTFAIDESAGALSTVPAFGSLEFTVNALGSLVGEHTEAISIEVDGYQTSHKVNAKVLDQLDASALDVSWPFFSGTNENTEHAEAWELFNDDIKGDVLISGLISHDQRSALVTYLNGSGTTEAQYLKFDVRIDCESYDYLSVTVNQGLPEEETIFVTAGETSWQSKMVKLPLEQNHVLFIYFKDEEISEGYDAAFLDNMRVCSDVLNDPDEGTCSQASEFYNTQNLVPYDSRSSTFFSSDSSGGGAFFIWILLPLMLRFKRV